jgi:hypothetical protein
MRFTGFGIFLFATVSFAAGEEATFSPESLTFFESKIRPVLVERCLECHGPEAQKASLRVDSRAALLRGGDGGPVVVPGDSAASRLIHALKGEHELTRMPKEGDPLSAGQIADVEQWIRDGAAWPPEAAPTSPWDLAKNHWAYQPLTPSQPASGIAPGNHPIDAFLESQRKAKGLAASPAAEPRDLVRRLSQTLRGLPPSYEEVSAFAADPSDAAWAQLVDKMLASPEYGERWGRHWLDIARYAETTGYKAGGASNAMPYAFGYRDWIIGAFNDDMPYDRFITLQLAADLLPEAERRQEDLAALGFITTGPDLRREDTIDDRIDVVTRGLLGTTVACARCHDHKFDPVSAKDYYALYAVFHATTEPASADLPIIRESTGPERDQFEKEKAAIEQETAAFRQSIATQLKEPEALGRYLAYAWRLHNEAKDQVQNEVDKSQFRMKAVEAWHAAIKEAMGKPESTPLFQAWKLLADAPGDTMPAMIESWKTSPPAGVESGILADLIARPPKNKDEVARRYAEWLTNAAAGKTDGPSGAFAGLAGRQDLPLAVPVDEVERFFHRQDGEKMNGLRGKLLDLAQRSPGAPVRAMVLQDVPNPPRQNVFLRGDPRRPGPAVDRRFLELLGGRLYPEGSGRLDLARDIIKADNPLTARVMVNRVWGLHFGKALVTNTSDFGLQTPEPLQRPLLDYLASWFRQEGWSVKKLHRLLLTSQAWKQSSALHSDGVAKDPGNETYWRMNRLRLDFESMRDSLLVINAPFTQRGGRSVDLLRDDSWKARSIYGRVDRYELPPWFSIFDFPNPNQHSDKRFQTTVSQQALFFLNSPFVLKQASRLADKVRQESTAGAGDPVTTLYRLALQRDPSPEEASKARELLAAIEEASRHPWSYEMARVPAKPEETKLSDIKPIPVFQENVWRFAANFPAPGEPGYLCLRKESGHTANGNLAPVATWRSPETGQWEAVVEIQIPDGNSNGVMLFVAQGDEIVFREEIRHHAEKKAIVIPVTAEKGQSIRFALGNNGDATCDSFLWNIRVRPVGSSGGEPIADYTRDFHGGSRTDELQVLAQSLLASNEFYFRD